MKTTSRGSSKTGTGSPDTIRLMSIYALDAVMELVAELSSVRVSVPRTAFVIATVQVAIKVDPVLGSERISLVIVLPVMSTPKSTATVLVLFV